MKHSTMKFDAVISRLGSERIGIPDGRRGGIHRQEVVGLEVGDDRADLMHGKTGRRRYFR